ncbi:hypothetical protein SAMN02745121_04581 [Nannocystis exedens]|uniref:Myxococcus cysteine-rich repeat-containing protein n=1 Tax=Nannocystis exedens TaxID=54 RepID=A0A1I2BB23_9BACT|nr:hypothetical protein [Nannocystis exedens]PCC68076.1 hypothetical protein NAEX_01084 [Nannocystis exedens]SFE53412.1 hypothetical protein SAMN02745121_04581 [Nannocystis exedens]
MHPARVLPVVVLLSVRCTDEQPSGFSATTPADTTAPITNPQSSFPDATDTVDPPTTTTGEPTTTTTGTTDALTGTTTDAASTSTTSTSTTTTSTTVETATTGPDTTAGVCGDGVVARGEVCDDGDADDADACLGDCTSGQALLVLAGAGTGPALAARFVPGPGWSVGELDVDLGETALVATHLGALGAGRRATADVDAENELFYTTWSKGQPDDWAPAQAIGAFGFGIDGPALAAVAETVTLAFLGTDFKHYTALWTDGAWAPFAPLPAGMPQVQAFGPSAAVLAPGTVETYAAYAGDNGKIFYSLKSSPGGAWQPSMQAPPPLVVSGLTPAALVDAEGDLLLAYVRAADGKIAVVKLLTPQNAWTVETVVDDLAITASELAFVAADDGAYYLAWRGYDDEGVYAVRGLDHDDWGAPFTVAEPATATLPPALARGTVGADAELVYVTGGALQHVRLVDEDPSPPAAVPGATGLKARPAAARVQLGG